MVMAVAEHQIFVDASVSRSLFFVPHCTLILTLAAPGTVCRTIWYRLHDTDSRSTWNRLSDYLVPTLPRTLEQWEDCRAYTQAFTCYEKRIRKSRALPRFQIP